MTLYEYISSKPEGTEIAVADNDYQVTDMYFYSGDDDEDEWTTALNNLAKLLTVKEEIKDCSVFVDLAQLIESKMDALKKADLFKRYDIEDIMADMNSIVSGYVSEEWMNKFVAALGK